MQVLNSIKKTGHKPASIGIHSFKQHAWKAENKSQLTWKIWEYLNLNTQVLVFKLRLPLVIEIYEKSNDTHFSFWESA